MHIAAECSYRSMIPPTHASVRANADNTGAARKIRTFQPVDDEPWSNQVMTSTPLVHVHSETPRLCVACHEHGTTLTDPVFCQFHGTTWLPVTPGALRRTGLLAMAGVFGTRAAVGWAGKTDLVSPGSNSARFRRLDKRLYSPLCAALAAGSVSARS